MHRIDQLKPHDRHGRQRQERLREEYSARGVTSALRFGRVHLWTVRPFLVVQIVVGHHRHFADRVQIVVVRRSAKTVGMHRSDANVIIVVGTAAAGRFGRRIDVDRVLRRNCIVVVVVVFVDRLERIVVFAFDIEQNDSVAERLNGPEVVGEVVAVRILDGAKFVDLCE